MSDECLNPDVLLDVANALPEPAAMLAHLADCAACQQRVREWAALRETLLPAEEPPPFAAARALHAIRAERRAEEGLRARLRSWSTVVVFVCASLLAFALLAAAQPRGEPIASVGHVMALAAGALAAAWSTRGPVGET